MNSASEQARDRGEDRDGNRPYLRDQLHWNWNERGRSVPPGESAAALRFRAYRQKMAMRAERSLHPPKQSLSGARALPSAGTPAAAAGAVWMPMGPAPLASDATGDGGQDYNWVSGRATSVLIDPVDTSGNTVLLGGAYGGLWKSTNAGSQSSSPASVAWQALIDDEPTLAVGAIALQPGNSSVILVGTGETNNSSDSYYGLGILLSTNGGSSWTQITGKGQPADQSFLGIGFSKIAFSTVNSSLVVAATAGDNGLCLGEETAAAGATGPCLGPQEDGNSTALGLYYSLDAGVTWNRATMTDGSVPASATSVIFNPSQGTNGTFYAFVRRHGLYSSTDGENFTPLGTQPGAGLASANCPASSNATTCLIYRGELAVVPGRNEMYVWVVDVQPDGNGNPAPADEGIWQSTTGGASWTEIPDNGITNCGDSAFGQNNGCGVEQGWYNLALAAIPDGAAGTDVYAGAVNLYKCTLEPGSPTCTQGDWINLTHAYGCSPLAAPAHVHPDQHGIAFMVANGKTPGYFAHDGGISRTLDGYAGLATGSCTGTNQFDSLSETLGSMTEFVSVSVDPASADILLGGSENNGSPKTGTATSSTTWQNALGGDGGFTAINPTNPSEWFAANPYVTILKCESGTACNDNTFSQVVGPSDLGGDQGAYDTPYILDPQNASEMLVGTCRVWRIGTSGTAPLELSNDFDTLGEDTCTGGEINLVTGLAAGGPVSASGYSETVYAVTNGYGPLSGSPGGEVWVTTDAGVTLMTNVTGNINPNGYAISSVAMDSFVEPMGQTAYTAYVGIMGFSTPAYPTSHVWQTADAGASWTDWSGTGLTELPDAPVNALLVDPSTTPHQIYAGTDVGVFVSSTTTPSWTEVDPAPGPSATGFLPNAPVTALQLSSYEGIKTLVASTYGRGIWNAALAPNFTITVAATPNATVVNQNVVWNGTLKALDGYSGSVTLTCTAGHPGTCGITPGTVTPSVAGAPFTVTLGSATAGTFEFTIQGTDGTLTHATPTETLTVGTDVSWTIPSGDPTTETVLAGQSASYTFLATPKGGTTFSSTVTFACTGNPALTSCDGGFSPASIAAGTGTTAVTLTISTTGPNANAAKAHAAKAHAGVGTVTRTTDRTLWRSPWFRLELWQNRQARGGDRLDTVAIPLRASPFFALTWLVLAVGMAWGGRGKKKRGRPRLYIGGAGFCLVLGLLVEISCGGVGGGGGGGTPDFAIAVTASPGTTNVNTNVTWNGTATALNGYSGSVTLTCGAGAPATCTLTPPTVLPTSAGAPFTVTLESETAGTFNFTIQGTDGTRTHATPTETLTVQSGETVTVTVSPAAVSLYADEAGNSWPVGVTQQQFTATVNNSTNQSVAWAVTGGSAGGSISAAGLYTAPATVPNPATIAVTATSTLATSPGSATVTVLAPTTVGTSEVTVTATAAGGPAHGDVVTLVVE